MSRSRRDDIEQAATLPDYAGLPIASRRAAWYWRVRLLSGASPVAWLMLGDAPAFALVIFGAAVASAVWLLASRVATFEVRVRAIRSLRERR